MGTPAFTILSTGHPLASLCSAILDLAAAMDHEKPMDTWAARLPAAVKKKPALPNKGSVRQSDPMGSRNPNEGSRNRSHRSDWHCTSSKVSVHDFNEVSVHFLKGISALGTSFYLSGQDLVCTPSNIFQPPFSILFLGPPRSFTPANF